MFVHGGALEHTLAPEDYWQEAAWQAEVEALFRPGWQLLALRSEVGRPGDRVLRHLLGVPVLLRNVDGALRAFHGVCAHRHCLVAPPGRSRGERLRCPYHGWEYGDDGRVARVPDGRSLRGLDAGALRLPAYPVEVLGELVFVHLQPGSPEGGGGFARRDPDGLLAPLGELGDELRRHFADHRVVARWETEHPVNWKVIAENAVESYHVPLVHPGTFRGFRDEALHDHRLHPRYTRYLDLKPLGDTVSGRAYRWLARALVPAPTLRRFTQTHVFPGFLLYYGDLISSFIALEPLGPERTRQIQIGLVPRTLRARWLTRPLQALFTRVFLRFGRRIMREDMRLWPSIQQGLRASTHRGVLSAREERVHAFQSWVAATRGAHREPAGRPAQIPS